VLVGPHQAQMIGAPALHEAQVIGVIDNPRKHWFDDVATEA
jgi:hypothetical protein